MRIDLNKSSNLFVEHSKTIEIVLRRAVKQALLTHKRAGNPIASWEKEQVVIIEPENIPTGDAEETKQI